VSLSPLHIATKGFLASTTLAIAVSGFIAGEVVAPEAPVFGGNHPTVLDLRKRRDLVHVLDYVWRSKANISFAALSEYTVEGKNKNVFEHKSLKLLSLNAASIIENKNVRETYFQSENNFNLFAESEIKISSAKPSQTHHKINSKYHFNVAASTAILSKTRASKAIATSGTLTFYTRSSVSLTGFNKPVDSGIDEVLAVAIKYLYG
jgi:hypothetical protein